MSNPFQTQPGSGSRDLELELLKDLERQSREEIKRLRAHERLDLRVPVVLQPASSSLIGTLRIVAETGDLSQGGCRVISPRPVAVGDVYRLEFERGRIELPTVFARCLRCRLLREDAFEAGFAFFTPIALEEATRPPSEDLLA